MSDREILLVSLLIVLGGAVFFRFVGRPLAWILGVGARGLAGGTLLWGFNLAGDLIGVHIGLNLATALVVGILGIPGLLLLTGLRLFLP